MRIRVLGVGFDNLTIEEAVERGLAMLDEDKPHYIVTPNPEIVELCREWSEVSQAVNGADMVLPDGIGIIKGADMLHTPLKERVPGIEFAARLMSELAQTDRSLFLLGGKPGVAEQAAENLKIQYPGLNIAGTHDGYFKEDNPVIELIQNSGADVAFICIGAPRQELWMRNHGAETGARLLCGLGGSLDVFAGTAERAPKFWRDRGLEWLYRLLKEPYRWRRMMKLPLFMRHVRRERLFRKRNGTLPPPPPKQIRQPALSARSVQSERDGQPDAESVKEPVASGAAESAGMDIDINNNINNINTSVPETPESVWDADKAFESLWNEDEYPEDTPDTGKNPEYTPDINEYPEDTPDINAAPEDTPDTSEYPEDTPDINATPEDTPGIAPESDRDREERMADYDYNRDYNREIKPDLNFNPDSVQDQNSRNRDGQSEQERLSRLGEETTRWNAEEARRGEQTARPARANRRRKKRWWIRIPVYLIAVGLISLLLAESGWLLFSDLCAFNRGEQNTATVVVSPGDDMRDVAEKLYNAGLIKYQLFFLLFARVAKAEEKIGEGIYELNTDMDYRALIVGMRGSSGSIGANTVRVTIPEGYSLRDIVALLARNGVATEDELMEAARTAQFDFDFIDNHSQDPSRLEGYLFPDTYDFYQPERPASALNKLLNNFARKMDNWQDGLASAANRGYDLRSIVTIASLIEKETDGTDQARIASVIDNRMNGPGDRGGTYGLLQIDASLLYVLDHKAPITTADLELDSPYNLYKYEGLPPTPIANPGAKAIEAALAPEVTDYYYYGLAKDGRHQFFTNYRDFTNFLSGPNYIGN